MASVCGAEAGLVLAAVLPFTEGGAGAAGAGCGEAAATAAAAATTAAAGKPPGKRYVPQGRRGRDYTFDVGGRPLLHVFARAADLGACAVEAAPGGPAGPGREAGAALPPELVPSDFRHACASAEEVAPLAFGGDSRRLAELFAGRPAAQAAAAQLQHCFAAELHCEVLPASPS